MPLPIQLSARDWLDQSPDYRLAMQHVDTLLGIQSTLARIRPELRLVVVSLKEGLLTLQTPNAASAARCRQSEPSIRSALLQEWPEVKTIRFTPQRTAGRPKRPFVPKRRIPPDALGRLDALGASLEDSPLRDALRRLVARQRG
ncbi:MAG: hypothetical protein M9951_10085 [Burkholderiaceae bacterium]|nr:hypothetical protein [Burkholderiaceae bacterium]